MKSHLLFMLTLTAASSLSVSAQESTPIKVPTVDQSVAPVGPKPGPEMQTLLSAMCGRWIYHFRYEPSESRPNGGTAEGEAVFKPGPGGFSMLEDEKVKEVEGESSGISVTWWDAQAQDYKAIWCSDKLPGGCVNLTMHREGDRFVLGNEFIKNGKTFVFREVVADVTPTSFTQTISQGEAGKELKRLVTIQAVRAREPSVSPAPKSN